MTHKGAVLGAGDHDGEDPVQLREDDDAKADEKEGDNKNTLSQTVYGIMHT